MAVIFRSTAGSQDVPGSGKWRHSVFEMPGLHQGNLFGELRRYFITGLRPIFFNLPNVIIFFLILRIVFFVGFPKEEDLFDPAIIQDNSSNILPTELHYSVEDTSVFCNDEHNLLIGVVSHPSEFQRRSMIRNSWAHGNRIAATTKVVFLVGIPNNDTEHRRLYKEMKAFKDVVQLNVKEIYSSLSHKTMALLMYKRDRCPLAKCFIKADSDNVLLIKNFEKLCDEQELGSKHIMGKCSVPRTVFRAHSKWAIPSYIFSPRNFPRFCSTGAYFFAGNGTVDQIIYEARVLEYFVSPTMWTLPEDALFTGIFAEKAAINRKTIHGLSFSSTVEHSCNQGKKVVYSIHMTENKDPIEHYKILREIDGQACDGTY